MLNQKNETNKEVSSTPISDEFAKYIFESALVNLELKTYCVSQDFRESLIQNIVNELLNIKKSEEFRAIINADDSYKESFERTVKEDIIIPETKGKPINSLSDKVAVQFCIKYVLNKNQSAYKEMYINDLLKQFNEFSDVENLDKFREIYLSLKKEFSSDDSFSKKQESDPTDKYYRKLIKLCNGNKKKFTDFCEKTEGKILSGFEKIAVFITKIVFGFALGYQQRFDYLDCLLEPKEYKPYLKDEYWNENVPSQNNKNEFTGDTNKITQDHINIKSKIPEKTMPSIQTNSKIRPLSGIVNGSNNYHITIEMVKLDQNGKKIKPKDEQK